MLVKQASKSSSDQEQLTTFMISLVSLDGIFREIRPFRHRADGNLGIPELER